MSVELVGITFDHASGQPETRALHIREDGATPAQPNVAAYALAPTKGEQLTIEVGLRFPGLDGAGLPPGAAVAVRAQATAASSDVLGNVRERDVTVPAANQPGIFLFELSAPKLHDKGVGTYTVAWEWQFKLTPTSPWALFHTSTATIYVTLDVPTTPWTQATDAASQRRWPWARMLNLACAWAGGVKLTGTKPAAIKKIAKRVEQAIYELGDAGKFEYVTTGDQRYVVGISAGVFNVTTFIDDVEGPAEGLPIYCTECAAAVATAVNCLGGDLTLLRLDRPTASIHLNSYVLIGKTTANEGSFSFHDIAVRTSGANRQVFDATLKPDWDVNVSNAVHDYKLTQGRLLGKQEVKPTAKKYLQRLLEGDVAVQWEDLLLCNVTMPCLDQCDGMTPAIDPCTEAQFMVYRAEIGKAAPQQPQLFPEPDQIQPIPIEGFRAVRRVETPARLVALAPLVSSWAEYWYVAASDDGGRHRQSPKVDPRQFKIGVCWAKTPKAAQDAMAWLMVRTTARLPLFMPKQKKIGDAAHGSPQGSVVYLVRGNVMVQVASVGRKVAPTELIAQRADEAILSNWSSPPPTRKPNRPRPEDLPPSQTKRS